MTDARQDGRRVLSVGEITGRIKDVLQSDPGLQDAWVQGEVSNFVHARSGHLYWTLKDGDASLRCVMWKGRAESSRHLPEDGAELIVHGEVSVYASQGQYQLYVDHLEPVGVGDLYRQFELLKARLEAEGLFDPDRKRPLPAFPQRIGVVTSRDAAALRDICRVHRPALAERGGDPLPDARARRDGAASHRGRDPSHRAHGRGRGNRRPRRQAASRICGPSTTSAWRARSPPVRCPSSPAWGTRPTSPSPTSPPMCALQHPRPRQRWSRRTAANSC